MFEPLKYDFFVDFSQLPSRLPDVRGYVNR